MQYHFRVGPVPEFPVAVIGDKVLERACSEMPRWGGPTAIENGVAVTLKKVGFLRTRCQVLPTQPRAVTGMGCLLSLSVSYDSLEFWSVLLLFAVIIRAVIGEEHAKINDMFMCAILG